ncbi:TPA: hypothetical protein MEZ67_003396 [Klebsiella pneumoniae]|nr:hypothetical protein [Klebsiella pneumoniae]HBW3596021.1 hypothetical protein [Klebsiella pneumoniae]
MSITSIYIDGKLPVIPGMKTLADFTVKNWFTDFPVTDGTPYAGYYFGTPVHDITLNSFDNAVPLTIVGTVTNANGYATVGTDNYLNTHEKSPVSITAAACFVRPPTPAANMWFLADFAGSGLGSTGWAIGIGANGKLRLAAQVADQANATVAELDFPASVPVGNECAITAFIRQGTITVTVYNPSTQTYVSNAVTLPGTRAAGTNDILIGRKVDNNSSTATIEVKAVVLLNGSLTTSQHIAVQQYLLGMA